MEHETCSCAEHKLRILVSGKSPGLIEKMKGNKTILTENSSPLGIWAKEALGLPEVQVQVRIHAHVQVQVTSTRRGRGRSTSTNTSTRTTPVLDSNIHEESCACCAMSISNFISMIALSLMGISFDLYPIKLAIIVSEFSGTIIE